jgi:hypothetical protein
MSDIINRIDEFLGMKIKEKKSSIIKKYGRDKDYSLYFDEYNVIIYRYFDEYIFFRFDDKDKVKEQKKYTNKQDVDLAIKNIRQRGQ